MNISRFKRYMNLGRALLIRSGWKRADYFKRIHHFKKQGEHCYFQIYNFGTEPHLIEIGDNVSIATGVKFINHDIASFVFNHKYHDSLPTKVDTITIGNNVFIGANAIILPGARIGNDCIVAAGAVVSNHVSDNSIVGGVPGIVIGFFDEYYDKYKKITSKYPWEQNDKDKKQKQIEFYNHAH